MTMMINKRNSLTVALALGAIGNHGVAAWEGKKGKSRSAACEGERES